MATNTSAAMKAEIDLEALLNVSEEDILTELETELAGLEEEPETEVASAEEEAVAEDDLDDLLADLELEEEAVAEVVEEAAAEIEESEPEAVEDDSLEALIAAPLEEVAEKATPAAKAKAAAKRTTGSATKAAAAGFTKASDHIRAKLGEKVYEYAVLTQSQAEMSESDIKTSVDAWLISVDAAPKKVREKVVNVLMTLAGHATLSCYTQIAVDMLQDMGKLTTGDIRMQYLKRPYSAGTSSSQSSQMTSLLPLLGLSVVTGRDHTANKDSLLLELLISKK